MSANLPDIEQTFSDRLEEFDRRIKAQDDTGQLVEEIHASITILMTRSGSDEDRMRELLQKRYNAGKLRLETYQLVRDVLDRVAVESMATMPDAADDDGEDSFRRTTVIAPASGESSAPQDHLQVGTVLRDRFLLQERVSGGSMGVVYKALDRRLAEAEGFDPWVAIKVLSPKLSKNGHALRALQQEAAKGRCLTHPNIVRFVDLDRDEDMYFIVMEWLEGRSLASILDENQNKQVDLPMALDIVRQVGQALDYAHRCGVIHADVKPANIMITPSGQVKLFDFGVARIRQKQHQTQADFDPGVLGAVTPAYSSMQVLTGEDPTAADDVFSLGCLMYRMVAGHRVFGPRNAAEAAEEGMEPQRPQALNDTQWRALKKALAFSRVARFATPAEFLKALDSDEPQVRVVAEPILVERKEPAPHRTQRWGVATLGVVVVGVVAALIIQPAWMRNIEEAGLTWLEDSGIFSRSSEFDDIGGQVTAPEPTAADTNEIQESHPAAPPPATQSPDETTAGTVDPDGGSTVDTAESGSGSAVQEAPSETLEPVTLPDLDAADAESEKAAEPEEIVDFSTLPPPTVIVSLGGAGSARSEVDLTIREGGDDAIVDLVRHSVVGESLQVRLEEVGFSGNQSPWGSGRLQLSNDGIVRFPAGQNRARLMISVPSNSVREADREATLLVRNDDDPESELAILRLTLEDDDQRNFESAIPQNAVGFSVGELVVRESDPAVLIDVSRFNPDDKELEVRYRVSGGTATEGDDYFLPGTTGLVFGPGQRSARLLIPLVQDSVVESDESFTLELVNSAGADSDNIRRHITVIIADDDARP